MMIYTRYHTIFYIYIMIYPISYVLPKYLSGSTAKGAAAEVANCISKMYFKTSNCGQNCISNMPGKVPPSPRFHTFGNFCHVPLCYAPQLLL